MDRLSSGLLLMALGVALLVWWYRIDRSHRELIWERMTTGAL